MANIRGIIKKLQTAIAQKDYIIRINTYQFYSDEQRRFITGYSLVHKEWQMNRKGEAVLKDRELINTCSQIEIVKYLSEIYRQLCEGENERADTETEGIC